MIVFWLQVGIENALFVQLHVYFMPHPVDLVFWGGLLM